VNSPGLIDSGYRGEVAVVIINTDKHEAFHIKRGDRIAQLVLQQVVVAATVEVETLDETSRGPGGFGSTGTSKDSNHHANERIRNGLE
jgi:dUTP pyrophosphatase